MYGHSSHHQVESIFKAFAKALRFAVSRDKRLRNVLPSTKGLLMTRSDSRLGCSSRHLPAVIGVSPLQLRVPHPSILRAGLSFDFPSAFAFRCHSERAKRRGISLRVPIRVTSLPPDTPLRGSELQLRHNRRRTAPSSRGVFSASLLFSSFSPIGSRICNSQPMPAIAQSEPS